MQANSEFKKRSIAVLKSFETADREPVENYISPEKYLQHDAGGVDGRELLFDLLEPYKEQGVKVNIKRVLEDGDYVALHSQYILGGQQIAFDVFRFENGLIVEHWDNAQEEVEQTKSGHSMIDGPTEIVDLEKTAANKAIIKEFVETILIGGKVDKLHSYFKGDHYIQHNPMVPDGVSGMLKGLEEMAKQGQVMKYEKLHKVLGEGNFVLTMSEGTFGDQHTAFYDIFRVENGKVAEHWDVMQSIPPKEEWKNNNGKF